MPKPRVTQSNTQINRLDKSAHNKVEIAIPIKINTPPIVGVPVFTKCVLGPSLRTACPTFKIVSLRITQGPKLSPINRAVRVAITALNVM